MDEKRTTRIGRGRGIVAQQSTSQNMPPPSMPPQIRPARIRTRRNTQQEIDAAIRANSLDDGPMMQDFVDDDDTPEDYVSDDDPDVEYLEEELLAAESEEDDEIEGDEEEFIENVPVESGNYIGNDGTEWSKNPITAIDTVQYVQTQLHHVNLNEGEHLDTHKDFFNAIFDEELIDIIVRYTNVEARKHHEDWQNVDNIEIRAFIGLLITAGVDRSSKRCYKEFFDRLRGLPVFKATLSLKRFQHLLRFIRFDDKETRLDRLKDDKLAAMREIFDIVIRNLHRLYSPGPKLTVDEQLVPFIGRCSFKQYMPSKSDKYGIKIFWLVDADTWYPVNGSVYLGKFIYFLLPS